MSNKSRLSLALVFAIICAVFMAQPVLAAPMPARQAATASNNATHKKMHHHKAWHHKDGKHKGWKHKTWHHKKAMHHHKMAKHHAKPKEDSGKA